MGELGRRRSTVGRMSVLGICEEAALPNVDGRVLEPGESREFLLDRLHMGDHVILRQAVSPTKVVEREGVQRQVQRGHVFQERPRVPADRLAGDARSDEPGLGVDLPHGLDRLSVDLEVQLLGAVEEPLKVGLVPCFVVDGAVGFALAGNISGVGLPHLRIEQGRELVVPPVWPQAYVGGGALGTQKVQHSLLQGRALVQRGVEPRADDANVLESQRPDPPLRRRVPLLRRGIAGLGHVELLNQVRPLGLGRIHRDGRRWPRTRKTGEEDAASENAQWEPNEGRHFFLAQISGPMLSETRHRH